jgi:hypothetical protein
MYLAIKSCAYASVVVQVIMSALLLVDDAQKGLVPLQVFIQSIPVVMDDFEQGHPCFLWKQIIDIGEGLIHRGRQVPYW